MTAVRSSSARRRAARDASTTAAAARRSLAWRAACASSAAAARAPAAAPRASAAARIASAAAARPSASTARASAAAARAPRRSGPLPRQELAVLAARDLALPLHRGLGGALGGARGVERPLQILEPPPERYPVAVRLREPLPQTHRVARGGVPLVLEQRVVGRRLVERLLRLGQLRLVERVVVRPPLRELPVLVVVRRVPRAQLALDLLHAPLDRALGVAVARLDELGDGLRPGPPVRARAALGLVQDLAHRQAVRAVPRREERLERGAVEAVRAENAAGGRHGVAPPDGEPGRRLVSQRGAAAAAPCAATRAGRGAADPP